MTPEQLRECIYEQAKQIGHNPKAEEILSDDPYWAYCYATNILKARFLAGEPVIMKHAKFAWLYAVNVLNSRWIEAEPLIAHSAYAPNYAEDFNLKITFSEP